MTDACLQLKNGEMLTNVNTTFSCNYWLSSKCKKKHVFQVANNFLCTRYNMYEGFS